MDATGGHVPRLWLRSASTAVRTLSTDVGAAAAPDARWRRSAVSPRLREHVGSFRSPIAIRASAAPPAGGCQSTSPSIRPALRVPRVDEHGVTSRAFDHGCAAVGHQSMVRSVRWSARWRRPTHCAARLHGELAKLGVDVSERTVSRLLRGRHRPPSQTWRTFLTNHLAAVVSMDFFTVPTVTGRVLFVLVLLSHQPAHRPLQHRRASDGGLGRSASRRSVS
jgi:hypothetical protein